MKWKLDRGWLLLITCEFKQWKSGIRTIIAQSIIDFTELRIMGAQSIGEQRALRYGDRSWQWRWTFWQERLWSKVGDFALRRL